MDKPQLKQSIIAALENNLAIAQAATRTAIEAATDEETVPEHKYDTLALEASYLAHGQAMRVQQCEEELSMLRAMVVQDTGAEAVVRLGSLVTAVDEEDAEHYFFLAPCAGGLQVQQDGQLVRLITPQAPIGRALQGKLAGDEVELLIAGRTVWYEVMDVI
jgi:transcription elongation GreA/GreB family factor